MFSSEIQINHMVPTGIVLEYLTPGFSETVLISSLCYYLYTMSPVIKCHHVVDSLK